jgi:general secretion pathway protein H
MLIELLVVLAILAVVLVAAPPLLSRAMPAVELRAAARDIATSLRATRDIAIATNREATFTLDVRNGMYGTAGQGSSRQLPTTFGISFLTAETERVSNDEARVRFFPNGGSTGGRIRLERAGRTNDVTIDWLTGHVASGK